MLLVGIAHLIKAYFSVTPDIKEPRIDVDIRRVESISNWRQSEGIYYLGVCICAFTLVLVNKRTAMNIDR